MLVSPSEEEIRITSYNVCYTKLLRMIGTKKESEGRNDAAPVAIHDVVTAYHIHETRNSIECDIFQQDLYSILAPRITSYNVCYTKLLR